VIATMGQPIPTDEYPPGWDLLDPLAQLAIRMWAKNDTNLIRILLHTIFETDETRRKSDRALARMLGLSHVAVADIRRRFLEQFLMACHLQGLSPHEILKITEPERDPDGKAL